MKGKRMQTANATRTKRESKNKNGQRKGKEQMQTSAKAQNFKEKIKISSSQILFSSTKSHDWSHGCSGQMWVCAGADIIFSGDFNLLELWLVILGWKSEKIRISHFSSFGVCVISKCALWSTDKTLIRNLGQASFCFTQEFVARFFVWFLLVKIPNIG